MSLQLAPSRVSSVQTPRVLPALHRTYTQQKRRRLLLCARVEFGGHRLHLPLLQLQKGEGPLRCLPQNSEVEELRAKLDHALQGEDPGSGLVQVLHDAARSIELSILEHRSSSRSSWLSAAWLGVDRNAWIKTFSYQVAICTFLQAAIEISSRGERRDRDINIFVQRSLLRLCTPLENLIRKELSTKQPAAFDWFWSEQYPMVVTSFVNILERDPRFSATTTECWKGASSVSGSASDLSLLMLALNCIAAVTKLGSAKVSCSQFLTMIPDITGRLMDLLVDFIPMRQAYFSLKDIGLRREFLLHFGARAASSRVVNEQDIEEISFWIDLVQKQLQQAIDRERIWSRLTTCESIEILEKDLAVFGFFIALGRNTQLFLSANGYSITDNQLESLIRYFISGSVLYYPQLSSISSYQLYVEVVCEELEWLPFYGVKLTASRFHHEKKGQGKGLPYNEVVSRILYVCSHWTTSFIKYSPWLENPSNIKAAKFLSKGHSKLKGRMQEFLGARNKALEYIPKIGISNSNIEVGSEFDTFDKALESVEEAIKRLEGLLQELHLSSSCTGNEQLKDACSDLEKIRKLKKEAEILEASFKENLVKQRQSMKRREEEAKLDTNDVGLAADSKPGGLWSFFSWLSPRRVEPEFSMTYQSEDETSLPINSSNDLEDSENTEIRRFEVLRHELFELESRVKRSTAESSFEMSEVLDDRNDSTLSSISQKLVKAPNQESFIAKSLDKLKEMTTDVLQGTQLLAIDVSAAVLLIKRSLTGDELAEKEKKALQRTLTDLASVVPIGILMLLPVTAVGHAAMLAAIQRYMPGLIPSTYAPERLDLLRQLERVKELEANETRVDENEPQKV